MLNEALSCHDVITDLEIQHYPDSKVHGVNMGTTWVLSAPDGPHVRPMNLAIKVGEQKNLPLRFFFFR